MKNGLIDLQNHLFEMIETLNDNHLKGDKLGEEIKRAMAIGELAKIAVANGALMVKTLDTLYGLDGIPEDLPLVPLNKTKKPAIADTRQKGLVAFPKVGRAVNV